MASLRASRVGRNFWQDVDFGLKLKEILCTFQIYTLFNTFAFKISKKSTKLHSYVKQRNLDLFRHVIADGIVKGIARGQEFSARRRFWAQIKGNLMQFPNIHTFLNICLQIFKKIDKNLILCQLFSFILESETKSENLTKHSLFT